jgi:zinc protease
MRNHIPLLLALCLPAFSSLATDAAPLDGGYAVVVSKATAADDAWKKAVDALVQKRAAKIIEYDGDVNSALPALKATFPRYACFVLRPEDAGREAVVAIHRLTRKLDDDPYTDCQWGIITGARPEDALRIASVKEPLVIRKAAAGTPIDLAPFDEGRWFSEGKAGEYCEKLAGGAPERKNGPADSTKALVDTLNELKPELFITSGHATERDWQPGYSYKNGAFLCKAGTLFGRDLEGKTYDVASPNPKVYLPAGNCLIGHVPGRDCMALAWLGSGGADQMAGYTVVTWYGAMGWGTKDYLFDLPGRYSLADAFFFANQSIVYQLETRFGQKPKADFDKWDMENDRALMGRMVQRLGYKGNEKEVKDHLGLLWDRDTVAFYGDPAWRAALAPRDPALTTELTEKDGTYRLLVKAAREAKPGKPLAMLLPRRVKNVEVVKGKEFEPLITDDFIMLMKAPAFPAGETEILFKAESIR